MSFFEKENPVQFFNRVGTGELNSHLRFPAQVPPLLVVQKEGGIWKAGVLCWQC